MWTGSTRLYGTRSAGRNVDNETRSKGIMISIPHTLSGRGLHCVPLLFIAALCLGVAQAAPPPAGSPTPAEPNLWLNGCGPCDPSNCPAVPSEGCSQDTIKDACGCCDICDVINGTGIRLAAGGDTVTASCAAVQCPRQQQCFLNIQGLPMCRCPTQFLCRRQPRREVCGRDGHTYRSRCYVQIAECTLHKKIRVAHRGACYGKGNKKHATESEQEDHEPTVPSRGRPEGRQKKRNQHEDTDDVAGRRQEHGRRKGRKNSERNDGEKKNKKKRRRKVNKNNKKDKQRGRIRRRLLRKFPAQELTSLDST